MFLNFYVLLLMWPHIHSGLRKVVYMHHSECCVCVVQIIDRKQHQCYPRAQHGVVRVKEPPHIRYTGPLTTKQRHKLERKFTNLFPSPNHEQLYKQILAKSNVSFDTSFWEALSESVLKNYQHVEDLLMGKSVTFGMSKWLTVAGKSSKAPRIYAACSGQ